MVVLATTHPNFALMEISQMPGGLFLSNLSLELYQESSNSAQVFSMTFFFRNYFTPDEQSLFLSKLNAMSEPDLAAAVQENGSSPSVIQPILDLKAAELDGQIKHFHTLFVSKVDAQKKMVKFLECLKDNRFIKYLK